MVYDSNTVHGLTLIRLFTPGGTKIFVDDELFAIAADDAP